MLIEQFIGRCTVHNWRLSIPPFLRAVHQQAMTPGALDRDRILSLQKLALESIRDGGTEHHPGFLWRWDGSPEEDTLAEVLSRYRNQVCLAHPASICHR